MSEEKDLMENEEIKAEETVEETSEETVEEVATEEISEDTSVEDAEEIIEEAEEFEAEEDEEKKVYTRVSLIKAIIITLVVCGILMVAEYYFMDSRINHYNLNEDGYAATLDDAAEQSEQDLETFKSENGLPEDMKGDTLVAVAQNYITVGKWLEMQGMGEDMLPMLAQMYGIDETKVNKDMNMGELNLLIEEAQKSAQDAPAEGEEVPAEGENAGAEGEEAPAEGEEAPAAE